MLSSTRSSPMRSVRLLALMFVLALAGTLVACNFAPQSGVSSAVDPMVLRAYDVPGAYSAEVGGMIRRLLKPNGEDQPALGSVSVGPGGKLLVAAPDGIQEGVQQLVDALRAKQPPPPASVTIETWIVAGRPAPEPAGLSRVGEAAVALEVVMRKEGPMEVELLEKIALTSISGQHAESHSGNVKLGQVATVVDDRVIADLNIDPIGPNEYSTRVELANGRMLVLGQAGYVPSQKGAPFFEQEGSSRGASLFYVVRATTAMQVTGT